MKVRLILFIFILFASNEYVKAQKWDTVFLDIPELKVNSPSFLYDLDTMLQKSYFSCSKNDDDLVYTFYLDEKNDSTCFFIIIKAPLEYKRLAGAKGFFKINSTCFFVKGIGNVTEYYPEGFFTITNNQQQFYYLKPPENMVFLDGECHIQLEYKDKKLYLLKKY